MLAIVNWLTAKMSGPSLPRLSEQRRQFERMRDSGLGVSYVEA